MTRPALLAIAIMLGAGACNSGGSAPTVDGGALDATHSSDAGDATQCECACSPVHVRFDRPADGDCWEISCEPYCGAPGFGNACAVL